MKSESKREAPDTTPAGIAGGQGHSAESVEASTLIGGYALVAVLGMVGIAALWPHVSLAIKVLLSSAGAGLALLMGVSLWTELRA